MSQSMPDFYLIEDEQQEIITLLQTLIQFRTEDPPGREIEIAQFLHETMIAWGLESELDEFEPGRANVVGRVRGEGALPGLIFSAHLDTMTIGTQPWTVNPFGGEIQNGKIYGRGASDMKGGLAAMLIAARKATKWSIPLQGDLILAWTAGESSNCLGAKHLIEKGDLVDAGAIIVSEPTSLGVLTAEKGTWWLKASSTGIPGHSSGVTGGQGTGSNAILKIIDLVQTLRDFKFEATPHPLLGEPTISIGLISGGTAINQTPDYAELGIDIRFLPGMETEVMLPKLQAIAGPEITFETVDWKPPVEIELDHPLVTLTLDACEWRLGERPTLGGVAYYSDAVIYTPALDIPRVIIGPGILGMSGTKDEYVEINQLIASAEIYQWLIYELLCQAK